LCLVSVAVSRSCLSRCPWISASIVCSLCFAVSLLPFLPVLVFSCPSGIWLTAFPLCSPLPGCLPFPGAPNRAASAWYPIPLSLQLSQQHPAPMAAASLAQGPALTVTHRADGGDFDEEATPPPVGTRMCVCVFACMHYTRARPSPHLPRPSQLGPGRSWKKRTTLSLYSHPVI